MKVWHFAIALLFVSSSLQAANYPYQYSNEECEVTVVDSGTIEVKKEGEETKFSGSPGSQSMSAEGPIKFQIKIGNLPAASKYVELNKQEDGTYKLEKTHDGLSAIAKISWDGVICEGLTR